MSPEAWAFFTANTVGIIGLVGEQIRTRRKVEKAADAAGEAAELARPTGNGFAKKVLDSNARQESRMDDFGRRLVRIEDRLDQHIDRPGRE